VKKYRVAAATIAVATAVGFGSGHGPASAETVCSTVTWTGDVSLRSTDTDEGLFVTNVVVPAGTVTSATWVSADGYPERVTAEQMYEQWTIRIGDDSPIDFTTDLPDRVAEVSLAGEFMSGFTTTGGTLTLLHRTYVDGTGDGTANSVRPQSVALTVCNEVTTTTSAPDPDPTTTEPPATTVPGDAATTVAPPPTVVDLTTELPKTGPSSTTRTLLAIGLSVFGLGVVLRLNQTPGSRDQT
jgi:LPXTG-motif cell wall-anchored protein